MLYEVNLAIDPAIAPTMEAWMRTHIAEMLTIDGFVEAAWYELDADARGHVRWSIQYRLVSQEALDGYLEHHAERMRADGESRFGDHFVATRRILHPRERFIAE